MSKTIEKGEKEMEKREIIQSTPRCPECGSPNTTKVEYECTCKNNSNGEIYHQCNDCRNIFSDQNIQ